MLSSIIRINTRKSIKINRFFLVNILKRNLILGIETSCDDTGCAVLDFDGNILGESLYSQHLFHLKNGGIIPPLAQDLHRRHIESVVHQAVEKSGFCFKDLSAISVTTEPASSYCLRANNVFEKEFQVGQFLDMLCLLPPGRHTGGLAGSSGCVHQCASFCIGLPMSLSIGLKYGKYLCRYYNKPFIPIHHMKAHALTARMFKNDLEFPFLVLLISGGHCLLAIAQNADDFILLGEVVDNAPGEIMDKIARRLKLKNLPEYSTLSGGRAMEVAASKADNVLEFKFPIPLLHHRNCNFSFAGLFNTISRLIISEEQKYNVAPDQVIPSANNLCAGFLLAVTQHLCHRVQRAMEFIEEKNLIRPQHQILVMSGGVACNNIIPKGIKIVCDEFGYKLVRPPPKLCTDNGVMIAWNGVERWKTGVGVLENFDHVDYNKWSPIGESIIDQVTEANLKCKWVKINELWNSITNGEKETEVV